MENIADICKYYCPIVSYNCCIVCADSKACQTFDFTLRNRPRLAEMWKYLQILANIGKYWQILMSNLFHILLGLGLLMTKTYQTFKFYIEKNPFYSQKAKGSFFLGHPVDWSNVNEIFSINKS